MPDKIPWYFKTRTLVVALLSVGPLALPLVWVNPGMSRNKKIIWTIVIAVASYFLWVWTMEALKKFEETYQQMKGMLS